MPNPQLENGHLDLNGGWIRLYRKALLSNVFHNPVMWKVWTYCLLKACHSAQTVSVKTGRGSTFVNLKAGQLVFQRNTVSKELNLPASTIRNVLARLQRMSNLTIFSDNHYSIVSISAWSKYQSENWTGNRTTKGQPKDNQQVRVRKNVKNVKNNRESAKQVLLVSLFSEIESSFTTEELKHKEEFLDYWTEKSQNAKKERWQKQDTFDPKRRFRTWLIKSASWNHEPSKPAIDFKKIFSASEVNEIKQSEPSAEFQFTGVSDQFRRLR